MNQELEALAIKVLDGESTVAERVTLFEHLDAHPAERALFDQMLADAKLLRADARTGANAPDGFSGAVMAEVARAAILPARISIWRVAFVLACGITLVASIALALARLLPTDTWFMAFATVTSLFEGTIQAANVLSQAIARLLRIVARQPAMYLLMSVLFAMVLLWAGVLRRALRLVTA